MSDKADCRKSHGSGAGITVKICGITNSGDGFAAIEAGADALGFNLFSGSKRFIRINEAANWIAGLPSGPLRVAVLVDPGLDEALRIARLGLFDQVQLHGNESPEFCRRLMEAGVCFTKALPMTDRGPSLDPANYFTDSVLLDSANKHGFGGTGHTFPWSLAREIVQGHPDLRVLVAGGLTPENVAEAISVVRPAGVDVTGGVEASFGRKDQRRLRAFISAAKAA